ncbi:MAG: diaminopimelate decarboxylase [Phycisphaerae bacterium]
MDLFTYKSARLCCEDVDVAEIARQVGTPVYIYSANTLLGHYNKFAQAFAAVNPTVCFAVKSLLNLHVLKMMAQAGAGFDVTSGGELMRCLKAGADPNKIAYAGVGKTDQEIREALQAGIGLFNVESEAEFENISRLAGEMNKPARAALRVNPDVYDPKTHTYTITGKKETKFGVDIERAERFFATYGSDANVALDAIHLHIGSPIYSADPYVAAIEKGKQLAEKIRAQGHQVNLLDIGGGYAADYEEGKSPSAEDYAEQIVPLLKDTGLEIVIEPGRQISCNAGILVTETQYIKKGGDRNFVIVDAAMTDLIRPALYDGFHFIYPTDLGESGQAPTRKQDFRPDGATKVDIVGGVCESSDFLGKDRYLPPVSRGDLLAVFSAGAYGFVMASNYNSRPRCPEVLVDGDSWKVIRRRETYDDLLGPELDLD